jgi:hypothetical protein
MRARNSLPSLVFALSVPSVADALPSTVKIDLLFPGSVTDALLDIWFQGAT